MRGIETDGQEEESKEMKDFIVDGRDLKGGKAKVAQSNDEEYESSYIWSISMLEIQQAA